MPELDRKALKEALDVALLDLEAAAATTKAEVFIRCGTGAGDLRDAIVSLRASLEEAETELERYRTNYDDLLRELSLTRSAKVAAEQRERRLREALKIAEAYAHHAIDHAIHHAPRERADLAKADQATIRAALSEEEA